MGVIVLDAMYTRNRRTGSGGKYRGSLSTLRYRIRKQTLSSSLLILYVELEVELHLIAAADEGGPYALCELSRGVAF